MSQKARVLKALQDAGDKGVRSDQFYQEFNGRGVARIYDLRKEGYEISDEREGKYKRYKLAGGSAEAQAIPSIASPLSVASSERLAVPGPGQEIVRGGEPARSVPSCFDLDADWAA